MRDISHCIHLIFGGDMFAECYFCHAKWMKWEENCKKFIQRLE